MKQLFTLLFSIVLVTYNNAQVTVTSDVTHTYNGYMNWFENSSGSKGAFANGSPWGPADLKTTIAPAGTGGFANGAITLQPNFNAYANNPGDAYWRDNAGAGPGGNKWMEANTYVEYAPNTYPGGDLTFKADINSNTLDANYTAVAFIKTLDPNNGYAAVTHKTVPLGATGTSFTVTALNSEINTAHVVQFGFTVEGLNANPDNEATLGSVVITPDAVVLSVPNIDSSNDISVYPNPIQDFVEIRAAYAVQMARVFDVSGKEVLRAAPNAATFRLQTANLNKGVYLLSLQSNNKETTAKLVK